jgi:TorA maturation chaperone TorD
MFAMRDWIETLIAHELAYGYLGKAFYEPPTKELLETLVSDDLFADWPLETGQSDVQTGLELLRNYCRSWREEQLESLQHDFRRLFIGPAQPLAVPWESVYLSPDHLLFGAQTVQVRRLYERFGMSVPNPQSEPVDHFGLEMRFVAHLCAIGIEAANQDRPDLRNAVIAEIRSFLSEHLLKWAPAFLQKVIENAKSDYYRGAAHLALGCLTDTYETLSLESAP